MTRKSIIKSAYGFNINDDFWKSVDNFVIGNFLLDSKNGDLTSEFLIDNRQKSSAQIVAKSNGVFAGRMELEYFLRNSKNSLNCMCCVDDGKSFKSGDVLIEVEGKTCEILVFERTILNLLMRMSGIATYVNSLCENLDEEVYLAATRKTLWGVLDKKAVETGGGLSHRINLSDGIMVKDTHLDFYSRDFARIFSSIESNVEKLRGARFIEIEIEKLEEFDAVYSLSKDFLLRHS